MRRALVSNASLYTRTFLSSPSISSKLTSLPQKLLLLPPISHSHFSLKFFSSEDDSSDQNPKPPTTDSNLTQSQIKDRIIDVEDVSNKELKTRIQKYFEGDEEALESVLEAILARQISGKHDDTDDEIMEDLSYAPVDGVAEEDIEDDFESGHETDNDVPDLYNAKELVVKRMVEEDEYFNMDDKKWNDIVYDASENGIGRDMKELEDILEDMRDWDKLLPDDIKQKVTEKFDELGDKCERQELEPEEAYQQFKEFEDKIVAEYMDKAEVEEPPKVDEVTEAVEKKRSDDPPGVGPILRWQTRVVFAPGGDAWHPKNRKVKLSVTVKELGLSKYQFRRLREIVGKRYHPGKDELMITSERFEHREENRKDCLRTLLSIIEEAGKASLLVEEARTSYVKQRLKANPEFMARLLAKKTKQSSAAVSA